MLLSVKDGPVVGRRLLLLLLEVVLLSRRPVPPTRALEDFLPFSDGMGSLQGLLWAWVLMVLEKAGSGSALVFWGGVTFRFLSRRSPPMSPNKGCQRRGSGETSLLLMRSSAGILR